MQRREGGHKGDWYTNGGAVRHKRNTNNQTSELNT